MEHPHHPAHHHFCGLATEISRILMGNKIAFYQDIAGFSFVSLVACVGLGILTGLISIAFVRSLGFWENLFSGVNKKPGSGCHWRSAGGAVGLANAGSTLRRL